MRTYLHLAVAMIIFTSCSSVSKLYKSGRYEDAYEKGLKKVVASKSMKAEELAALEAAYYKLERNDLYAIKNIEMSPDINRWEKIASIYSLLQDRKMEVERFWKSNISLVLVDYSASIKVAERNAFTLYLDKAKSELSMAKSSNDKSYARAAHHLFLKAKKYSDSIEIDRMISDAHKIGTINVGLNFVDNGYREDEIFRDQLLNMNLHSLSNFWVKYHWAGTSIDFDHNVDINLIDLDLHNEREVVNKHYFKSTVQDGYELKKDGKGNIILDSLSNAIKTVKYENVTAEVSESILENETSIRARISVFDRKRGTPIFSKPMETNKTYIVKNVRYKGDLRAVGKDFLDLCRTEQVNRLPSKSRLLRDLEYAFRYDVESHLSSLARELI